MSADNFLLDNKRIAAYILEYIAKMKKANCNRCGKPPDAWHLCDRWDCKNDTNA